MLNGIEYIPLNPVTPGDALTRLSIALNRLQSERQRQVRAAVAKQNRDEAVVLAGALILIVGLIPISQVPNSGP